MQIRITKQAKDDHIAVTRADGTVLETRFPKKGPVPHDATHFFAERTLGLGNGFWGMVAAGHHPEDIADLAKAAGHASASRARVPDAHIVELLQAERLVECFEAELWSPAVGDDTAAFLETAQVACDCSHVALPAITPDMVLKVRGEIAQFAQEWTKAPVGHIVTLEW